MNEIKLKSGHNACDYIGCNHYARISATMGTGADKKVIGRYCVKHARDLKAFLDSM